MTQYSLFGAAVVEPSLDDLDGVLLAGGQWVRSADSARLSVVVADHWRAEALAVEFTRRGVEAPDAIVPAEGGFGVRTGFTPMLVPAAQRWTRGANQGPPPGLRIESGGLRLWAIAAGRPDEAGYLLATDEPDDATHQVAGAQLARLGLAGVSVSYRGGPGWRITSAKRIRRLIELLGPAPEGATDGWPNPR